MSYLSVVIPVYKCSAAIPELIRRLEIALLEITEEYEIIFVNDGSPENDWEIVTQFAKENPKIKGINLSRNFGQHYAMADACIHLIKNVEANTLYQEMNQTHINIGTGNDLTIKELAVLVKEIVGFKGTIKWDS